MVDRSHLSSAHEFPFADFVVFPSIIDEAEAAVLHKDVQKALKRRRCAPCTVCLCCQLCAVCRVPCTVCLCCQLCAVCRVPCTVCLCCQLCAVCRVPCAVRRAPVHVPVPVPVYVAFRTV